MPVRSRLQLRQGVGTQKLRDTYVGTTTASVGAVGSVYLIDSAVANLAFSGETLYARTWLKVNGMQLMVATFNTGSGAYVTLQTAATAIGSGAQYEHHRKLSPAEKDRCIDGIVTRLWSRQEVPINTVAGALVYSLGSGFKIFGAYYLGNPAGSLDRGQGQLAPGWNIVSTATGRELRLVPGSGLAGSQQLIIDAQVRATLGAADAATVNIPDENWVLDGIAARCYQSMAADAPGQEAGKYAALASAYAKSFVKGIGAFRDPVDMNWRGAFDGLVV